MAKYVIEIPDSEEAMWEGLNGDLFIPITMNKGTKTWVNTDLKMTPYVEPDEDKNLWDKGYSCGLNDGRKIWQDEIKQKVEQEVWEFATTCTKMDGADSVDVFSGFSLDSFTKFSYQEAKDKYETWKKQKKE